MSMSSVSHPWPNLAALIQAARDRGETYRSLEYKAGGEIGHSEINNIALGKGHAGKWPATVPKLKALAGALGLPWAVVRDAVMQDTGVTLVAEYDGARAVVARAEEELDQSELEAWQEMATDIIKMIKRRREGR